MAGLQMPAVPGFDKGDDTKKVASQLEAYFLRRVLAEVHTSGGGLVDGGFAGDTFKEMLDGALADSMAGAGGIGLAPMFQRELDRGSGKKAAPATAPVVSPPHRSIGPVVSAARAARAYEASGPLSASPLAADARLTSSFGERHDPIEGDVRAHAGLDLAAPAGTPVRAAGPGVVVRAGDAGGYGNMVVIDHGGGVTTRYAHLARADVKPGDHVAAGAAIGAVGQTGRTTGPHLHFEVRRDGQPVDPRNELTPLKPVP